MKAAAPSGRPVHSCRRRLLLSWSSMPHSRKARQSETNPGSGPTFASTSSFPFQWAAARRKKRGREGRESLFLRRFLMFNKFNKNNDSRLSRRTSSVKALLLQAICIGCGRGDLFSQELVERMNATGKPKRRWWQFWK
jgi:hypothetical protein